MVESRPVERAIFWSGVPNSAQDGIQIMFVPSLLCNDLVATRCATHAFDSMSVSVVDIGELPSTLVTRALARVQLWEVRCPMPQEVRFSGLAQVLETVFTVCSWTSWLVRREPVQVEPLCISEAGALFVVVAIMRRTAKWPKCGVTHFVKGRGWLVL
jgi:hypothetical protein